MSTSLFDQILVSACNTDDNKYRLFTAEGTSEVRATSDCVNPAFAGNGTDSATSAENMVSTVVTRKLGALQTALTLLEGNGSAEQPYKMRVDIRNNAQTSWQGVIRIDFALGSSEPNIFLPAFMVGHNRGQAPMRVPQMFARLRAGSLNKPASSWWMVRADRLANPCALAVSNNRVRGLAASPYLVSANGTIVGHEASDSLPKVQYNGFTCALAGNDSNAARTDCASVGMTIGYENAPWLFIDSSTVLERASLQEGAVAIAAGATVSVVLDIFDYAATDERGIVPALEHTYKRFHELPRAVGTSLRAIEDLSRAIFEDAWLAERHMYAGFVFDRPSMLSDIHTSTYDYQELGSSAWTNGMATAAPMLASAIVLKDEAMRCQALEAIDYIVDNCMNPESGLPFDAVKNGVWSNHGWWFDGLPEPGHSGYLVGQMLYYVLQSYKYEQSLDNEHTNWLAFAAAVIPKLAQQRNSTYEYPYIFDEHTAAGIDYNSFAGAWCLAASALYAFLSDDMSDISGLIASEQHYYDTYICHMECYGAPLDAQKAVDSEGVLAYIKALRWLYELTGNDVLLDHMRDAFAYEYMFKFCWNSPVSVPPLSHVGWSSCGGSVTSTCNPHIHPMSSNILGEMQWYTGKRDDAYVRSRMRDTLLWSCQTYNTRDNEYDYGRVGWMSERFCHSQGLLTERYPDGSASSTWFALMPWASGAILDGLTSMQLYAQDSK